MTVDHIDSCLVAIQLANLDRCLDIYSPASTQGIYLASDIIHYTLVGSTGCDLGRDRCVLSSCAEQTWCITHSCTGWFSPCLYLVLNNSFCCAEAFKKDPSPKKLNLGVGAYR